MNTNHPCWGDREDAEADRDLTPNDIGFFRAGEKVWFCGQHSDTFSVRGTIEEVIPQVSLGKIIGVDKYGVRLENGNYKLVEPNQVRERGVEEHDERIR